MDKWRCSLALAGAITLGLPGLARAELVDIVWKSLVGSIVVVELEDGAQVTGKLAGFDESQAVIVRGDGMVLQIDRADVVALKVAEEATQAPAQAAPAPRAPPDAAAPPSAPAPPQRDLGRVIQSARASQTASLVNAGVGIGMFASSFVLLGVGGATGAATDTELPGAPIAGIGALMLILTNIPTGVSGTIAGSAHLRLLPPGTRRSGHAQLVGLRVLGITLTPLALGLGAAGIYLFLENSTASAVGPIVVGALLAVAGHVFLQLYGDIYRRKIDSEIDKLEGRAESPATRSRAVLPMAWAAPTRGGLIGGLGLTF